MCIPLQKKIGCLENLLIIRANKFSLYFKLICSDWAKISRDFFPIFWQIRRFKECYHRNCRPNTYTILRQHILRHIVCTVTDVLRFHEWLTKESSQMWLEAVLPFTGCMPVTNDLNLLHVIHHHALHIWQDGPDQLISSGPALQLTVFSP